MTVPKREFSAIDFKCSVTNPMRFPFDSSTDSSEDSDLNLIWKDYCPQVFRRLQELEKIAAEDYMLSISGHETLTKLTSQVKTGCLLNLSHDDRFVIKIIRKSEIKVLLEMLPNYYKHVEKNEDSLLTKFFGLHAVKPLSGREVHFVVMGNIFCSAQIHKRFHLKGSSQGRFTNKVVFEENTTFKDLDLDFNFYLGTSIRDLLLRQVKVDCEFLEAQGIMNYSLLLGLHFRSAPTHGSRCRKSLSTRSFHTNSSVASATHKGDEVPRCVSLRGPSFTKCDHKLGAIIPAYAYKTNKYESVSCHPRVAAKEGHNVVLYVGIINTLQDYSMAKRIEHAYKSIKFNPQSISAVNPKAYSTRFQDFLCTVFPQKD